MVENVSKIKASVYEKIRVVYIKAVDTIIRIKVLKN